LMVPWPCVIFCAEAHAGIQVKAIPEDKMKVMRRMGDLALGRTFSLTATCGLRPLRRGTLVYKIAGVRAPSALVTAV
jgi:hypothetical protein